VTAQIDPKQLAIAVGKQGGKSAGKGGESSKGKPFRVGS